MEFVCIAILTLGCLFVISIIFYSNKKYIEEQLKPFCKKEHLKIENNFFLSSPKITGTYRKLFPVDITVSTDNKNPVTDIEFYVEASNLYFHLRPRKYLNRTGNYTGSKYIETGNGKFDLNFVIESNKPEKIKEIFKNHIQQKLLNCREKINISLQRNRLFCQVFNQVTGASKLTEICEILFFIGITVQKKNAVGKKYDKKQITDKSKKKKKKKPYINKLDDNIKICPSCNREVPPPENKFCIFCGQKL